MIEIFVIFIFSENRPENIMNESEPSVFSSIKDDAVVDHPRRPKKWMKLLLVFSVVVIVIIATLLILDYLIPACMSTIRPCQTTSGMKWMASKEKLTREESKKFCQSKGLQPANITIAKEIFAENKGQLDPLGNFWIIG